MRPLLAMLAVLLALPCAPAGVAAWPANGIALSNAAGATRTTALAISADGSGGALIVWGALDSLGGIAFQVHRVDGSGGPPAGWTTAGKRVGAPLAPIGSHVVVPDGAEGAIIVWTEGNPSSASAFALRITASGTVAAGWPARGTSISSGTLDGAIAAVEDGAGGVLLAWRRTAVGLRHDVHMQHLLADGSRASGFPAAGRSITGSLLFRTDFLWPSLVRDPVAGSWLSYTVVGPDPESEPSESIVLKLLASGLPDPAQPVHGLALPSPSGEVIASGTGVPVALAPDGAGGTFAFAISASAGLRGFHLVDPPEIDPAWPANGQLIATSASLQSTVLYPEQITPIAAGDGAGGAYVGWVDAADPLHLRAARILMDGSVPLAWLGGRRLNGQMGNSFVADAQGLYASSTFAYTCPHYSCYGPYTLCRFDSAGSVAPGWPDPSPELIDMPGVYLDAGSPSLSPRLCSDGANGVFAAWIGSAARYGTDGPRVMRWDADRTLGAPAPPATAGMTLTQVRYSPGTGVEASFSLPVGVTASLTLHDLLGRRVSSLRMGNGSGRVTLPGTHALPAGLYLVQLASERGSAVAKATAKVAVTR